MRVQISLDANEKKTNIGFVKAMVESELFTSEDLKEICSLLYVESFMFGDRKDEQM